MTSSLSDFDAAGPDVPPSTISARCHHHHHHHHHHHQMTSSFPVSAASYPTLSSAVDVDCDLGYWSGHGDGCCVPASASFVDARPLPLPMFDCACSDGRFRPRWTDNSEIDPQLYSSDRPADSSSFKDAAAQRLLRMPDRVTLPVADSAVNCGLEDTGTSLRTADVFRSRCTDSPVV